MRTRIVQFINTRPSEVPVSGENKSWTDLEERISRLERIVKDLANFEQPMISEEVEELDTK